MTTFTTSRDMPGTPEQVFAAMSDPARLARWWGPAGFTNTFEVCEFRSGGRWTFTMHGPDGANYRNESVFAVVEAPNLVVIRHLSEPRFTLTIGISAKDGGAHVTWLQAFEDAEVGKRVAHIVEPSNEQNLDRLSEEVARG